MDLELLSSTTEYSVGNNLIIKTPHTVCHGASDQFFQALSPFSAGEESGYEASNFTIAIVSHHIASLPGTEKGEEKEHLVYTVRACD